MYTIGEFSNLAHVSARSLRYYDAMGLLRPAHMGENGYRYYTGGQLPALAKIETLKSYGFTLAEVKELLLLPETELAHRIHVRRISAYAQLNEMRRVIRRMEAAIVQMEGTSMANDTYHVILMQAPAQKVFSVRRTIQIGEMHDLFATNMDAPTGGPNVIRTHRVSAWAVLKRQLNNAVLILLAVTIIVPVAWVFMASI